MYYYVLLPVQWHIYSTWCDALAPPTPWKDNTNICGFLRFHILEKWTDFLHPLNGRKREVFQLQRRFGSLTP